MGCCHKCFQPFAVVEGTNISNGAGWSLFGLQFYGSFHILGGAWVAHNDYSKAGFKLLPGGGAPTRMTALQAIMHAVMMIPVGVLPYYFGLTGIVSFGL